MRVEGSEFSRDRTERPSAGLIIEGESTLLPECLSDNWLGGVDGTPKDSSVSFAY